MEIFSFYQKQLNSFKSGILLWEIDKQYSPRCDIAFSGVPSGAILFSKRIFVKNLYEYLKSLRMTIKMKMDFTKMIIMEKSIFQNWVKPVLKTTVHSEFFT